MDSRLFQVLEICLPVFAVIGLGKVLQKKKIIGSEQRHFINHLVFYFSLPALIFCGVASQQLDQLFDPGLFIGAFLPIMLVLTTCVSIIAIPFWLFIVL